MKVLILAVVVLGLTGCYEVKEVDTVAMKINMDTVYTIRSTDGYRCRSVRAPVPEKGKVLSCLWESD